MVNLLRFDADASGTSWRVLLVRLARPVSVVALLAGLVCVWLASPLREWADPLRLLDAFDRIGRSAWALPVLLLAYLIGGLVVFPVNVLIAVTILAFGPVLGSVCALSGSLASAVLVYEVGRGLRSSVGRHRLPPRLRLLGMRLRRRGLPAIILLRIVPVAPYSVINFVAGAARIPRRDYALGTVLGMLPGILVSALFVDRAVALIQHPRTATSLALIAAAAVAFAFLYLVRRHLSRLVRARGAS